RWIDTAASDAFSPERLDGGPDGGDAGVRYGPPGGFAAVSATTPDDMWALEAGGSQRLYHGTRAAGAALTWTAFDVPWMSFLATEQVRSAEGSGPVASLTVLSVAGSNDVWIGGTVSNYIGSSGGDADYAIFENTPLLVHGVANGGAMTWSREGQADIIEA